ncbi:glycosyltransferase family 4 protein [Patescibacteria group bacterium]|nr:glycosyltransferase family 4 protein [Patescibacteria group bacterium]MBU1931562.1 glycosyltransferase family 4 protein [Patescibacteria group bacterium]
MKLAIVRGKYLNQYEMQNYAPLAGECELVAFASQRPIHAEVGFPVKHLWSPADLPDFPYKMPILNRLCFGDAMYLHGLEKQLDGFDIAHVAETYFCFTRQAIKARQAGRIKKLVCTVWETIPFNNENIWPRKRFKQAAFENIDLFIAVTQRARKALLEEGCPANKIAVQPMGVDLRRFQPKIKKPGRELELLFVGRLEKEKGILELVEAFRKINRQFPHLKLTLVGQGSQRQKIHHPKISFKTIPYQKINQAYQQADIFILPSKTTSFWEEQFGMVLVEAMACGLPIITTKSGAIPEVVGKSAFLIEPGDEAGLTNAISQLVNQPKLRDNLAKQARRRAEKYFNAQKIAQKIKTLYQAVLK